MEGPYDMSQQKGYKLKGYCNKEIYGERTTQSSKENLNFFKKINNNPVFKSRNKPSDDLLYWQTSLQELWDSSMSNTIRELFIIFC